MSRARDTADQINRINSSAADATAITVNSSENVGIGTDSPSSNYGFSKTVEIQGGVNAELSLSQTNNSKDWSFGVGNGNCYQQTNSGQTYSWYTGGVEKLRIQSGGGISFNGDTAAANALDDYEEGTWEPTIIGTSSSPTVTYQADTGGSYTKIGRVVYYTGCVRWTALSGGSGTARIGNLPFTSAARTNGDNADSIGSARTSIWNGTSSNHPTIIGMVAGNTTLTLIANDSTGTAATLQIGDLGTTCSFQFTCIAYV